MLCPAQEAIKQWINQRDLWKLGGTNLHGKLVDGHIAKGVRCTTQLVPNINSLQALGNMCFHKYESWVEAISWFLRDSDAKRWKASTKEKCEEKINKDCWCSLSICPEGGKKSKLILLLRNHFGAHNPQTTSRSDFSTERNSNHFQNTLLCSDVLFSWIKMYALVFLHGVQRCSCSLCCLFVYE